MKCLRSDNRVIKNNNTAGVNTVTAFDTIAALTIENGGGTFDIHTLAPVTPTSGYAVALVANDPTLQGSVADIPRIVADIRRDYVYVADYVGTWIDNGIVYIDPVTIITDYTLAAALGKHHGQLAIYSFADNDTVTL